MTSLAELRGSRELLVNLTQREVSGKYKRSVLGQAWSLLNHHRSRPLRVRDQQAEPRSLASLAA